ncbi:MAG: Thioredoxin-disulfide reductase [Rhodospirillales bacterium]|nr:Thioredoxin-disulfide reductase [Rhodospirillales bacterium]
MSNEYEIIIAGGGIAGLTAGLTAARLGRRTLILSGDQLGGNLLSIEKIEGFPGFPEGVAGFELCPSTQMQAAEAGCDFETIEILALDGGPGAWQVKTGDGDYTAKALILATGASLKTLDIPGEEEFKGRGVSHCASCDAPLLRGQPAVVVGGGDSALQEALTLANAGAPVTIVQKGAELTAQAAYRDRVAAEDKIKVRCNESVAEIVGSDGVEGVKLTNGETIAAGGVFVYIGFAPNTGYLDGKLKLDERGAIVTDRSLASSVEGIFAAGALRAAWPGRAVASAGDGAMAAISADAYLKSKA